MSELSTTVIENVIENATKTGEILVVSRVAKQIASKFGGSPKEIADSLTQAGIRAGVTMQFGAAE